MEQQARPQWSADMSTVLRAGQQLEVHTILSYLLISLSTGLLGNAMSTDDCGRLPISPIGNYMRCERPGWKVLKRLVGGEPWSRRGDHYSQDTVDQVWRALEVCCCEENVRSKVRRRESTAFLDTGNENVEKRVQGDDLA